MPQELFRASLATSCCSSPAADSTQPPSRLFPVPVSSPPRLPQPPVGPNKPTLCSCIRCQRAPFVRSPPTGALCGGARGKWGHCGAGGGGRNAAGGHRLLGAERGPWVFPEGGGSDTQGASCPPGIVTKGSEMYDCYVTSYSVSSSRDGRNWRPYRGSGGQEDKVGAGALVLGWAPAPARSSGAIPATSARCLKATWTAAGRSPTPSSPRS